MIFIFDRVRQNQRWNRSGKTGPVRPDRTGAGPDRLKWLDRPVFTGFYRFKEIFKSQKLPLVPLRVMRKIEFYNFPNMESFLIKDEDSKFRCNYQNNRIVFKN